MFCQKCPFNMLMVKIKLVVRKLVELGFLIKPFFFLLGRHQSRAAHIFGEND